MRATSPRMAYVLTTREPRFAIKARPCERDPVPLLPGQRAHHTRPKACKVRHCTMRSVLEALMPLATQADATLHVCVARSRGLRSCGCVPGLRMDWSCYPVYPSIRLCTVWVQDTITLNSGPQHTAQAGTPCQQHAQDRPRRKSM